MTTLSIPHTGLALSNPTLPKERAGEGTTQIIRLDLPKAKSRAILDVLKSRKKITLQTGKQTSIQYGEQKIVLQTSSDLFPSDFYIKSSKTDAQVQFSGRLSHALEIQRAREVMAETDEALTNLENTLKSMKEERAQNEVSLLQTNDMKSGSKKDYKPSPLLGASFRKDHLLGGMSRSTPSSPHLGASRSPNHGPTSAPLMGPGGGAMSKDKLRLEAIKIPLIHLLACRPMSIKSMTDKLRARKEDCERLLEKYARDSPSDATKKELKEKSYKDLDIWKFPYQNDADRVAAIERAIHAFDRMRVDKADSIWQLLLPPNDRGKGKVLSKLNLNKPIAPQASLKPERGDGKGYTSDIEKTKSPNKKVSESKAVKRMKSAETVPTLSSKTHVSSPLPDKKKKKNLSEAQHAAKADSKFKSAERIEDSDEEAEGSDAVTVQADSTTKRQPASNSPSQPQKRNASPKKQIHKSTLSNSSSGSDSSDNQNPSNSLKIPSGEKETKHSPRPRHDSSPQKPSPLGSSPPTNSTDFDSSSSSKQSQSSAPSSPPSSTDMPIAKSKQKYSPVISEKPRDVSRGRAPVKRKADEQLPQPPAKRPQVNGSHTEYQPANNMNKSTERPPITRKETDSDQSSTSEKGPPAREEVLDEAKRFQRYYNKYKELHEKLGSKPEAERDEKDMENLLMMHKRLKEMKAEIWGNWEKVEKTITTTK